MFAAIDPGQRALQGKVAATDQRLAREFDGLIGNHPAPIYAHARPGHEITPRVDQDVAVRQLVEERGQRLPHRRLAEHALTSYSLPPARKSLRRASRHAVDEHGDGSAVRLDALAGRVDQ